MTKKLLQEFNELINPLLSDIDEYSTSKIQNDKFLIPIIAETTQGIIDPIEDQTTNALSSGIKLEYIVEMVYQLAPVIGISKVKISLKEIQKSFDKNGINLKSVNEKNDQFGTEIQNKIYGTEIKNLLSDLPNKSGDFISKTLTEHFFNDFYKRDTLNVKERDTSF